MLCEIEGGIRAPLSPTEGGKHEVGNPFGCRGASGRVASLGQRTSLCVSVNAIGTQAL